VPAGPNSAGGRCILGFDLAVQVEDSAAWSEFNDLALVQLGDLARSRSRLSGSRAGSAPAQVIYAAAVFASSASTSSPEQRLRAITEL